MLSLRLCVQLVTRCALWTWDPMLTFAKDAVAYLCRAIVALLHSMPELKFSPLELAACFQIIDAIKRATIVCALQGSEQKPATSLLSVLCLMLAMMGWHVPRFFGCHTLLCRTRSILCMPCCRADYTCIAMAFVFPTFGCTQRKRAAAPWRAANAAASNHVLRWALRCLNAAINGMELGNHSRNRGQEVHLEFATTVEVWAGTRSTFTRESYELGNAAVRVVAPSAHMRARPGGAPWNLELGRAYTWPLDLQKPAHAKKLMEYVRKVKPAPGSNSMHLHTSPPCGTFSPVQRIVKGRGGKPRTPWPIALQRLEFARRLHRAWSRRASPGRLSSSHEQAKDCTIHPHMRKRGPEDHRNVS